MEEKNTAKSKAREYLSIWILLLALCGAAVTVLAAYRAAAAKIPSNVGRKLSQQEQAAVIADNSPLTQYVHLSPNADFPREGQIKKITIHHMADEIGLERLGEVFGEKDRKASSNYAIDIDGGVALYVEERNRSWASSSPENDHQAVTIEVANDEIGGQWHVSDASYETLIQLCVDICQRNGIGELVYTGDATGNLTVHKMFSEKTECPGPYLSSKMPEIAREVNTRLEQLRQ